VRGWAESRVVIIAVVPQAYKFVWVPFLRDLLPLSTGPIRLARTTGAPLLPVFTVAKDNGRFKVSIHEPLYSAAGQTEDESLAKAYAI
jgi:lauroyl/myristoyl acyltransferase